MTEIVKLKDIESAIKSLKSGLGNVKDDLDRDGLIQRFEFTFELLWKVIQEYARYKGVETASPRDAFRIAGDLKLIDNPNIWFEFLKDRNLSTHVYSEDQAVKIASHIPSFVKETEKLIYKIKNE